MFYIFRRQRVTSKMTRWGKMECRCGYQSHAVNKIVFIIKVLLQNYCNINPNKYNNKQWSTIANWTNLNSSQTHRGNSHFFNLNNVKTSNQPEKCDTYVGHPLTKLAFINIIQILPSFTYMYVTEILLCFSVSFINLVHCVSCSISCKFQPRSYNLKQLPMFIYDSQHTHYDPKQSNLVGHDVNLPDYVKSWYSIRQAKAFTTKCEKC